jgi:predicted metal-dependent peptidase
MANYIDAIRRVKAQANALVNEHIFLKLILSIDIISNYELEVPMRTYGHTIHIHPDEIMPRSDKAIRWLLLHEALHSLMGHFQMVNLDELPEDKQKTFRLAADLAVNMLIHEYPGRDPKAVCIEDPEYDNIIKWISIPTMTMDIYHRLQTMGGNDEQQGNKPDIKET